MKKLAISYILCILLLSCASYQVHPGSVDKADSVAFDTLTIAQAVIEQSKMELAAGTLPNNLKEALNRLIESYDIARSSWILYRSSVRAGLPPNTAGFEADMNMLSLNLGRYEQLRSIK